MYKCISEAQVQQWTLQDDNDDDEDDKSKIRIHLRLVELFFKLKIKYLIVPILLKSHCKNMPRDLLFIASRYVTATFCERVSQDRPVTLVSDPIALRCVTTRSLQMTHTTNLRWTDNG